MVRKNLICKSIVLLLDYLVFGSFFLSRYTMSLRNAINRIPFTPMLLTRHFIGTNPRYRYNGNFLKTFTIVVE
jgi:hypothetical protein